MSLHERVTRLEAEVQRLSLALEGVGRGASVPRGYPTLDEALKYAESSPTVIHGDCVQAWLDDRERLDWHVSKQGNLFPLPESRTALWADLRTFARTWTHFEHERTAKNGNGSVLHAKPKQETVWALQQSLQAVKDKLEEIESYRSGAWSELPKSKKEERAKLLERKREIQTKLAGLTE